VPAGAPDHERGGEIFSPGKYKVRESLNLKQRPNSLVLSLAPMNKNQSGKKTDTDENCQGCTIYTIRVHNIPPYFWNSLDNNNLFILISQRLSYSIIRHLILHGLDFPFFSVVCLRWLQDITLIESGQINSAHDYPLRKLLSAKTGPPAS